jgi:DNA repair protein RAD7
MDGTVLDHWGAHLKSLTRLELLGPFCVRKDAWIRFFEVIGSRLEGFLIVNSPRFDLDCAKSLATHCSESLTELRLSEVEHLNEGFIPPMANFQSLTSLDLSYPSESISDDMAITLLSAVGGKLTSLNLSGNDLLTDEALIKGVQPYTRQLDTFVMACVPLLTDDGVAEFFSSYIASKQIKNISLSRNHLPSSNALTALLSHSGTELKELDVNCWRDASVESLMQIGEKAKYLKKLDVGWCRNMDDFVVKAVLDGCPMVEEIKCFGCNRITENCPRKVS